MYIANHYNQVAGVFMACSLGWMRSLCCPFVEVFVLNIDPNMKQKQFPRKTLRVTPNKH